MEFFFYINAFNKGFIFNKRDIDYFLKQLNLEPLPSFYAPCSNIQIIKRVIRNLINSYEKLGYAEKIQELESMYEILKNIESDE